MKNIKKILYWVLFFSLLFSIPAFAHGGRTDAYGGHHDYDNISGLGSYHYHHGYSAHLHPNGICPYDSQEEITAPPAESESDYYYESDYGTSVTLPLPTYSYTDSHLEENLQNEHESPKESTLTKEKGNQEQPQTEFEKKGEFLFSVMLTAFLFLFGCSILCIIICVIIFAFRQDYAQRFYDIFTFILSRIALVLLGLLFILYIIFFLTSF